MYALWKSKLVHHTPLLPIGTAQFLVIYDANTCKKRRISSRCRSSTGPLPTAASTYVQQQQQQFLMSHKFRHCRRIRNFSNSSSSITTASTAATSMYGTQSQQQEQRDDDDTDDEIDDSSICINRTNINNNINTTASANILLKQKQQQSKLFNENDTYDTRFHLDPVSSSSSSLSSSSSVLNNNNTQQQTTKLDLVVETEALQQWLSPEKIRIPMLQQQQEQNDIEISNILSSYDIMLQERSKYHFGYPYNLQYNYIDTTNQNHSPNQKLQNLLQYTINNLGDPYITSNYGIHSRIFEIAVIDFFAQLWDFIPQHSHHHNDNNTDNIITQPNESTKQQHPKYWGYITASGTEGNLHGILCARECFPNGIVYTSTETHYSIFKAMKYYRMDYHTVATLPNGEMNYDKFQTMVQQHKIKYGIDNVPIIVNVNIGTTVKGAIDNLNRIVQILHDENISRNQYYIHCDGALFGLMIPFLSSNNNYDNSNVVEVPTISFSKQPIDSITVSGHKMLGCPIPCGIAFCRYEHIQRLQQPIDYINSIDTTIMGSRNGHAAIYMWYALRTKGYMGMQSDISYCIELAQYLYTKISELQNIDGIVCGLNACSNTVVIERPTDVSFIQKWQLACTDDIAHVVVMPNISKDRIDEFVLEYTSTLQNSVRIQPSHINSPLSQLRLQLW